MGNEVNSGQVLAPEGAPPGQAGAGGSDHTAPSAPAAPPAPFGVEPGEDPATANRTGFAQAGAVLVALFAQQFKDREVPGLVTRRVKLSDPGVSTDGGTKA